MNIVQPYTNHVDAAIALARHFPVIPTHSPENGGCSCRKKAQCSDPGKHPRTRHGLKNASQDEATIRAWWSKWPEANVGVATGVDFGFFVLDVDGDEGRDSLAALEKQRSSLPQTVTATTGKGEHFYFKCNHPIRTRTRFAPGLDCRGDGGMVVAPGSIHANGKPYSWINPPDEFPMAEAPDWLLNLIGYSERKPTTPPSSDAIPKGKRNDTLFKMGCSLRAKGLGKEEIFIRLRNTLCDPPLLDSEIRKIAHSASQYEPSKVISLSIIPPSPKVVLSWAKMPLRALMDPRMYVSPNYLAVLGIVSSCIIREKGYATIRQQTITDRINANRPNKTISLRTVKRVMKKIAEFGYIRVHLRKTQTANGYRNESFIEILYEPIETEEVGDTLAVQAW